MSKITKLESLVPQAVKRARVAAYTRVSADGHMPLHSLSAQVSYYSTLIQRNPEWEGICRPGHFRENNRKTGRIPEADQRL